MNPSRPVPVLLRAPDKPDAWGRLLSLTPSSASLETRLPLKAKDFVCLGFELAGEDFQDVEALVLHRWTDQDGYTIAQLELRDRSARARLARLLADLLSRAI